MTAPVMLELDGRPASRRQLVADVWRHRHMLWALARTNFQTRYKRAALGVLWVVALPLLQAAMLAVILSKAISFDTEPNFAAYVLTGMLGFAYFQAAVSDGSGAVVDGASMADKIWFPRAILPLVPVLSSLVALTISTVLTLVALPFLDTRLGPRLLLLVPAVVLLVAFTTGLSLVLAALHVYIRDVKHLVQAGLVVWFYATPIFYPSSLLKGQSGLLDFNPMTGVVELFRRATIGSSESWVRPLAVTLTATVVLWVVAVEVYRRHDRLFADRL